MTLTFQHAADPQGVTSTRDRGRRPDIQGLRAIAVLMVVAFHAGLPVPGGFVGVDVFFVISGYVITAMLMREWADTGRVRLGRFYLRRFKRLTPALAVTVGVVMVASALLLSPFGDQQTAAKTGIGAMLLAANVVIARTTGDYFDAPAEANPLLHTWSLSVEEQFYLVFPALLLAAWVLGKRARRSAMGGAVVVGLVGATSFALALAGSVGLQVPLLPDALVGFYGPATRAWEFAAGALLALGGARLSVTSYRLALPLAVAGGAMLTASLWLITATTPFPGAWTLLPVVGTALLISAGATDGVATRALSSGPLVALGDRSYSIYLWHWPFIVFAQLLWPDSPPILLAAAALSFIPAYASYRWLEQPIRVLPIGGRAPLARLVAVTVVPPLALAGALAFAANHGFWNATVKKYVAALQPSYASRMAGCHEAVPMGQRQPENCMWNATATGSPIYLVGDSNADHFSDGIILAAESLDRPVLSSTASGCPFVDVPLVPVPADEAWYDSCRTYVEGSAAYLASSEPGTVIVSNTDLYWSSPEFGVATAQGGSTQEEDAKLRALQTALVSTTSALEKAGHQVLLIQSVPRWADKDALKNCSLVSLLATSSGCTQEMPVSRAEERQLAVRRVISATADTTGAVVFDPWPALCSTRVCRSAEGGLIRYRDGTHITVEQSEALADTFTRAIGAAG